MLLLALDVVILPFLSQYKLENQIFNFDTYCIWLTGIYCFTVNFFYGIFFNIATKNKGIQISFLYLLVFLCSRAIFSTFHLSYLISFFCYINIILFITHFSCKDNARLFLSALLSSLVIQLVISGQQAIHYRFNRLSIVGTFSNSGFFANYLSLFIPIVLLIMKGKNKKNIAFYFIFFILLLLIVILLLTKSRAAFLGCFIGMFFYFLSNRLALLYNTKKVMVLIFSIIGIGVILFVIRPDSAIGRLIIYRNSIYAFVDNGFFGVGPGFFSKVYNEYQLDYFSSPSTSLKIKLLGDNVQEAFNIVLQILVEYGAIGLVAIAVLLINLLSRYSRNYRLSTSWQKSILSSLIIIFSTSLFSNPFHITAILFSFILLFAILIPKLSVNSLKEIKVVHYIWAVSFYLLITVGMIYKGFSLIRGELLWNKAIELAHFDNYKSSSSIYELAYNDLNRDCNFLYNYGAESLLNHNYKKANQILLEASKYDTNSDLEMLIGQSYYELNSFERAEYHFLRASNITPSHFFPKFRLIELYINTGQVDKTKILIKSTLSMPIKIKTPEVEAIISKIREIGLTMKI